MRDKRQKKHIGNGDFTRNRIFEIAAEVFHRKGYDNTSMSDVATAAGLTKAGLYHHVSSKESLLYTVLDSGLDLTESYVMKPLEAIADPVARRTFLRLMGASLALAGVTGCTRQPPEKIVPYVQAPEDVLPLTLDARLAAAKKKLK